MQKRVALPEGEQRLHWRVSLIVGAVSLASALVIILLGWWAMSTVDHGAQEREVSFAQQGLQDIYARIPTEQESSVIWSEAVERVKAHDQLWMTSNLGEWMGSYFGFNQVFVLNERNAAVHAMENGNTLPAETAYDDERAAIEPLVVELRRQISAATAGLDDSTEAIGEIGIQDFIILNGAPAIVSIKPIIPDTDALTQRPGSEYLHIAVRFLDDSFVNEIAEKYQLTNARIAPQGENAPESSIPIANASGETLAYFFWDPYRPGLSMVEKLGRRLPLPPFQSPHFCFGWCDICGCQPNGSVIWPFMTH